MKVFVYGTLRKGCGNHGLLHGSTPLGKARLNATMYSFGYIPYVSLMNPDPTSYVHGEVYEIDEFILSRLDQLEGYREGNAESSFYNRSLVRVLLDDENGKEENAYVYHIDYRENNAAKRIASGDWLQQSC